MKTVLRCLEDVLYRRARSYLPFNFANAKIRVAIRLAEDGKIMGNLLFELYPRMISIEIFTIFGPFCKSWHWNLGIGIGIGNGIGIGTDITNAIISSSIRPMNSKLSRVVT